MFVCVRVCVHVRACVCVRASVCACVPVRDAKFRTFSASLFTVRSARVTTLSELSLLEPSLSSLSYPSRLCPSRLCPSLLGLMTQAEELFPSLYCGAVAFQGMHVRGMSVLLMSVRVGSAVSVRVVSPRTGVKEGAFRVQLASVAWRVDDAWTFASVRALSFTHTRTCTH